MKMDKTPTLEVLQMNELSLTGNVIPHAWYKTLVYESGKPNLVAILVLAEICYWYKPSVVQNEYTGEVVRLEKKFSADKLQRSYSSFESMGLTKRQAQSACQFLKQKGLITLETRTVETKTAQKLGNVLFIGVNVEEIRKITFTPSYIETYKLIHSNVQAHTFECMTYTENTTESTTLKTDEKIQNEEIEQPDIFSNVRTAREVKPSATKKSKRHNPNDPKGHKLSDIAFELDYDIMKDAEELGYEKQDIADEFLNFKFYYTEGKGKNLKILSWAGKFINGWLYNNYKYGRLRRNGQFYKLDANSERIRTIEKLTDPDFFAEFRDED